MWWHWFFFFNSDVWVTVAEMYCWSFFDPTSWVRTITLAPSDRYCLHVLTTASVCLMRLTRCLPDPENNLVVGTRFSGLLLPLKAECHTSHFRGGLHLFTNFHKQHDILKLSTEEHLSEFQPSLMHAGPPPLFNCQCNSLGILLKFFKYPRLEKMIWILLLSVSAGGLRSEAYDQCLRAMLHMYGPWLQHVWPTVGDGSSIEMNDETSCLPQGAQGGKCSSTVWECLISKKLQNSLRQNSSVRPLLRDCPSL